MNEFAFKDSATKNRDALYLFHYNAHFSVSLALKKK